MREAGAFAGAGAGRWMRVGGEKATEDDIVVADDLADHIIGMLTNMIKKLEKRF